MQRKKITLAQLSKFVIPSVIGILLFLVPFKIGGEPILVINLIINKTKALLGKALVPIVIVVLFISAICSLISYFKPDAFKGYWKGFFNTSLINCLIRVFAAIVSVMIYFKIGPEFIWSSATGGMMMSDVVANLIPFFFWCGIFMPLLTEFGLMEFVGNMMRPIMRPLYKVPGRSAVNAAVAWVGSGTMGIILTDKEYQEGYYTKKESVIISTGFAIPSIAIVALLTSFLDLSSMFPIIYIVCIVVGLVMQVFLCRIPPISCKKDSFCPDVPKRDVSERPPEGYNIFTYAVKCAVDRAAEPHENLLAKGLRTTFDVWFTLEPIVLGLGTVATIACEYTPIIQYMSMPLAWFLNLLGLQEAALAAQSMLLGFIDVFLPFISGAAIVSAATKFVIAVVCSLQIIFITETGPLLLKVDFGLNFIDIIVIFLMRTILATLLCMPILMIIF